MKVFSIRYIIHRLLIPSLTWLGWTGLIFCRTLAEVGDLPLIHAYSAANSGVDGTSWITVQGPDGVLYFGADSLLSFDGEQWRHSPVNGAFALRGLDFGNNGRLWAAAVDEIGWFEQNPSGLWIYHSLVAQLPAGQSRLGEVWHAFADGDGAIFFTAEKILRWDGKKFQLWSFPGARRLPAMRVGGTIYFHHTPTGLYAMGPEGPQLIIPSTVLGGATVRWMEARADGFLLATAQGVFTYTKGQLTPFSPETAEYISYNLLTSAARLPDGRLVVGTFKGGLIFLRADGSLDRIFSEKDGLPTNSIFSLFLDREKQLWATSNSIIFNLTVDSSSTLYDGRYGFPAHPSQAIVRQQGKLTVATDNGVYEFQPEQGRFQALDSLPYHIWDMRSAPDGLLVASLWGVKKNSQGKSTVIYSTLQDAFVVRPSRIWPNSLLISEGRSIVLVAPDGTSRILVENLPDAATSIAEDNQGRLWLGTSARAILQARPDAAVPVQAVSAGQDFGLPDTTGESRVTAAPDGTVLAFSSSGGWLMGRNSTRFAAIEGFPAWKTNAVSEVAADGTLWVVHPGTENRASSTARVAIQGERAVWQPHSVDGLWNIGIPSCIFTEVGTKGETILWIGGTTALMRNAVSHGPVAPVPAAPLLRALARSKDNDALQPMSQPLPYSTRAIFFEFAAPEFARRPALHLETMLVGVDQHWMPAGASAHREFTALRDGRYDFRVRAVAETGVASPATNSHFEITPPWWRTGPALLGALLALVPAGYGIYRQRVRRLRQHNVELEQKVLERTAQLEKASAAKTQFVANMSHDIRNPLNGIVGLALALEDTWLDVKQRELVATLRECTTYLSTLVDDVLDFATIEAGRVELRPGPFAPVELLRSIAMMFKMEAIASGAVLHVEADPQLTAAYIGDAGRIQQILVNFITNALKYSGGPIKLTVTIPTDAPEEIEFSVADEGPGISEEGQRLLFTKFSRLTGSQSKEITGTGLGLASCRLLAGLMSGSVGVRSSAGHGARFYLRLPLDVFPVSVSDSPATPVATPILPNCTVLLVEDTNYNAMAATAVLAKFGLPCERAINGAEALKLFAEKRHNLVLLDRNLPDMDGTEVARRIRALEANGPRTIILAVTAYCTLEDRALCLNAGMDAFVGKPLTPQKLRRVLTAAGRRHLAAASMHVSPDVSSTGVDVSLLEYISDGTDQGLGRQIELFLTALGEAEKQLQQAARTADFKLLGEAAHGVLSHARLVGSASLSTAAAGLQNAANAREREAFGSLLTRVQREIESLTAVVRRHPGAERPA